MATLPALPAGVHQLSFRNRHDSQRSVYLANALVPESDRVAVTAQRRDGSQSELVIEYRLDEARTSVIVWLLAGVAIAGLLEAGSRKLEAGSWKLIP
jgi:hypothetical protein